MAKYISWHISSIFLLASELTHPRIQRMPNILSSRVKRLRREDDYSLPYNLQVKNSQRFIYEPPICLYGLIPGHKTSRFLSIRL
jgi:hypothetical protein